MIEITTNIIKKFHVISLDYNKISYIFSNSTSIFKIRVNISIN